MSTGDVGRPTAVAQATAAAEFATADEIEILGRQRPPVFPNWYVEVGFVFASVSSLTMSEYTISGFNIALPALAEVLHIPESARIWPAAVPSLTAAVLLLPFARLSDCYGGRLVFLLGHGWLLLWSIVCGFSHNTTMLIVCRAMQGLGVAAFLPAAISLMGRIYRPGPRKNLVFGIYGAFGCIGFYFGIFMGALSAEVLGWRWYFWIGAVCVAVVAVVGFLTIPSLDGKDPDARMDWPGVCTIIPGLTLVVYALTDGGHAPDGWRTPYIYVTFVVGCLFLCGAVYVQGWVSAQPLFPAAVLQPKYMKRLVISLFLTYGVLGIFLYFASFYIQTVAKATPLMTAAWFSPFAIGGLVLALIGGFMLHMLPGRILLAMSGLGYLASVLLFALIPEGEESSPLLYWKYIFPAMICHTIGADIAFNVTNVFITTALPSHLQAVAGGLVSSLLFLGVAFWLGVADLATSVAMTRAGEGVLDERQQYRVGFFTGVGLSAVSLCLFLTIKLKKAASDLTADEMARVASR